MKQTLIDDVDYIVIGDGNCPKCGKPIPMPKPVEGDAVMCDCSIWFVDSNPKHKIVCHDCPNKILEGRQLRCKACNIKKKLAKDKYSCILKELIK
jgi:hypothetical protein